MDNEDNKIQAWIITAEENYAHARDHEHLRAQITAILVAAAFVLIGFAIDKKSTNSTLVYVGIFSILIGVLNVYLVRIHNNRFNRHVEIARNAKSKIAVLDDFEPMLEKKYSLSNAWVIVASLPIIAGLGLIVLIFF